MILRDILRSLGFGEWPELIVFFLALVLFLICLYGLIRKRKKILFFLAMVVLAAVMVLLNPYDYFNQKFGRAKEGESIAQSALKTVAAAQDKYFNDHNRYTKNVSALAKYGFKQSNYPGVLVIINQADGKKWSARAGHQSSENRFTYSSETGAIEKISE